MLDDFRLRAFLQVAESGSFTAAAKVLGVSQPAVSQNINSLETATGVKLFDRSSSAVNLTPAGHTFKDYAEKILYWYDSADRMFGEAGLATVNHPVTIRADHVVADYILPIALSRVSALQPQIRFDILSCQVGTTDAIANDIDISVRPSPDTMDFERESLLVGVMDAAVVASPVNRVLAGAAVTDDDGEYLRKPFSTLAGVHVSNRFAVWKEYYSLLTPDLVSRVAFSTESIEAIKALVETSSNVVGVLPACSVREEQASGKLLRMPVSLPEFAFDIHFSPSSHFAEKKICRMLKDALKTNAAE